MIDVQYFILIGGKSYKQNTQDFIFKCVFYWLQTWKGWTLPIINTLKYFNHKIKQIISAWRRVLSTTDSPRLTPWFLFELQIQINDTSRTIAIYHWNFIIKIQIMKRWVQSRQTKMDKDKENRSLRRNLKYRHWKTLNHLRVKIEKTKQLFAMENRKDCRVQNVETCKMTNTECNAELPTHNVRETNSLGNQKWRLSRFVVYREKKTENISSDNFMRSESFPFLPISTSQNYILIYTYFKREKHQQHILDICLINNKTKGRMLVYTQYSPLYLIWLRSCEQCCSSSQWFYNIPVRDTKPWIGT